MIYAMGDFAEDVIGKKMWIRPTILGGIVINGYYWDVADKICVCVYHLNSCKTSYDCRRWLGSIWPMEFLRDLLSQRNWIKWLVQNPMELQRLLCVLHIQTSLQIVSDLILWSLMSRWFSYWSRCLHRFALATEPKVRLVVDYAYPCNMVCATVHLPFLEQLGLHPNGSFFMELTRSGPGWTYWLISVWLDPRMFLHMTTTVLI